MSTTNMPALEQACRNMRGHAWGGGKILGGIMLSLDYYRPHPIRAEYNRLLRLKKSKKRWRA